MNIRTILLNLILTEKEKLVIREALSDSIGKNWLSLGESYQDIAKEMWLIKRKLKVKTKEETYFELEE